jgi:hypothetical protein
VYAELFVPLETMNDLEVMRQILIGLIKNPIGNYERFRSYETNPNKTHQEYLGKKFSEQ